MVKYFINKVDTCSLTNNSDLPSPRLTGLTLVKTPDANFLQIALINISVWKHEVDDLISQDALNEKFVLFNRN